MTCHSTSGYLSEGNENAQSKRPACPCPQRPVSPSDWQRPVSPSARQQDSGHSRRGAHPQWGVPRQRKDEILPLATTWMDLEGIRRRGVGQTDRDDDYMVSLRCGIKQNPTKQMNPQNQSRLTGMGAGGQGWAHGDEGKKSQ